jgi:hypothetical protein
LRKRYSSVRRQRDRIIRRELEYDRIISEMFCIWACRRDGHGRLATTAGAPWGLRGLFRLDVAELARVRGLGDAKAVRVKATLELGGRLAARSPEERPPVGSPEDVANLLGIEMAAPEQEQLRVVLLDTKHRILGTRTVYQGSVNQKRIGGPLLNRIDIHFDVPRLPHEQLSDRRPGKSSAAIQERVARASDPGEAFLRHGLADHRRYGS